MREGFLSSIWYENHTDAGTCNGTRNNSILLSETSRRKEKSFHNDQKFTYKKKYSNKYKSKEFVKYTWITIIIRLTLYKPNFTRCV